MAAYEITYRHLRTGEERATRVEAESPQAARSAEEAWLEESGRAEFEGVASVRKVPRATLEADALGSPVPTTGSDG